MSPSSIHYRLSRHFAISVSHSPTEKQETKKIEKDPRYTLSRTRVQFVSTFTTATGKGRNNEERKEPC